MFSSVCLPGPPAAGFIVLNQMPSHTSCRWTLRSMEGKGGKLCAWSWYISARSYSTSRSSPSGYRTRGKMAKKKQHFLPREAEAGCTGCPVVWQSSGELYLPNLLPKGRISVALGPLCCSGLGITAGMCLFLLHSAVIGSPFGQACRIWSCQGRWNRIKRNK